MKSQRVPPCSAREPLPSAPTGDGRGNLTHASAGEGGVISERGDPVRNDGPDQPRSLVIPITLGGVRGAIVKRCPSRTKVRVEAGEPTRIILRTGQVVLVDAGDASVAETHYLCFRARGGTSFVDAKCVTTGKFTRLGRILLPPPPRMVVDHINGDGLDNRRCNLRVVTSRQNSQNRAKMRGTTSRFKGVCRASNSWVANLCVDYSQIYLGSFDNEQDAARAYDAAARKRFGSCAALNFPLPGEQSAHRRDSISNFHSAASSQTGDKNNAR